MSRTSWRSIKSRESFSKLYIFRYIWYKRIAYILLCLDTLSERDSLIESVFPKLKDYCREKYSLEFQVCIEESYLLFSHQCSIIHRSMLICDGGLKWNQLIIIAKFKLVSMKLNYAKNIRLLPILWSVIFHHFFKSTIVSTVQIINRFYWVIVMVLGQHQQLFVNPSLNCYMRSFVRIQIKMTMLNYFHNGINSIRIECRLPMYSVLFHQFYRI